MLPSYCSPLPTPHKESILEEPKTNMKGKAINVSGNNVLEKQIGEYFYDLGIAKTFLIKPTTEKHKPRRKLLLHSTVFK